jgi:hypothetical protein
MLRKSAVLLHVQAARSVKAFVFRMKALEASSQTPRSASRTQYSSPFQETNKITQNNLLLSIQEDSYSLEMITSKEIPSYPLRLPLQATYS